MFRLHNFILLQHFNCIFDVSNKKLFTCYHIKVTFTANFFISSSVSLKSMANNLNVTILNLPYDVYYICSISFLLIILSWLLLLVILTSKNFRSQKEYILLTLNLVHEFVYGVAWFSGSLHRIVILYRDKGIKQMSENPPPPLDLALVLTLDLAWP